MSTSTIRLAEEADLSRITEIYAEAVLNGAASYELEPPTLEEMTARYASLRQESYPYLVVEAGEGVLGYAYAGPFRPRPAYRFIVEDSIYLAPQAQGRGLGQALLSALVEASRALGFRQIVAVIGDGRPDSASVRVHEKAGFQHSGALIGSGYKHGRWLDTVFMQLALNGGATRPPDPDSMAERAFRARGGKG